MAQSDAAMSKRKRAIHQQQDSPMTSSSPPSTHDDGHPSAKRKRTLTYGGSRKLASLNASSTPVKSSQATPPPAESAQTSGRLRELLSSQKKQKNSTALNEVPETPPAMDLNPFSAPPKGRKRRQSTPKSNGATGFFIPEEIEALENFKIDFCTSNGIEEYSFNEMVQHSARDKGETFPHAHTVVSKVDFWKEIYGILPKRDKRSVYRFMRRHFQNSDQKPHEWTDAQDNELKMLHLRYGPRWKHIAKIIGRSDDDVVQRWKNKLEHRDTMNTGAWSPDEENLLREALQAVYDNMKAAGEDVGMDIFSLDEGLIRWGVISNKMGNCRSRQQCADKWRKWRQKYLTPSEKKPPRSRSQSRVTGVKTKRNSSNKNDFKSAAYVNSDDSDDDAPPSDVKIDPKDTPSKSQVEKVRRDEPNQNSARASTVEVPSTEPNEPSDKATSDDESSSSSSSDAEAGEKEDESEDATREEEEEDNAIAQTPNLPQRKDSSDEETGNGDSSTESESDDNIEDTNDEAATIQETPTVPESKDPSKDASDESDSDSDSESESEDDENGSESKNKTQKSKQSVAKAQPNISQNTPVTPSFWSGLGDLKDKGMGSLKDLKDKYMSPSRRPTPPPPSSNVPSAGVNLQASDSDNDDSDDDSDDSDSDSSESGSESKRKLESKQPVEGTSRINGSTVANRKITKIETSIFSDSDNSPSLRGEESSEDD